MDRRTFLAGTMATAAAARLHASAQGAGPAGPASDRVRIGFAGMGARAQELVDAIAASGANAEVVALCDAYRGRAERGKARAGGRAAIVDDYRRLLDDRTIDAVFIATPDHWHSRMAIDAVSAGKDVYIEKPMTYTVDEGLDIIAAVDRHKRIFQVGSQGVSGARQATARELVKSGRLGAITDDPRRRTTATRTAARGSTPFRPTPRRRRWTGSSSSARRRRSRSTSSASSAGAATGTIPAASPPTSSSTSSAGSTS